MNTEQLGSIFDAQPSELKGNIHNVNNADEPVIGFMTETNLQSKRIFIAQADLPKNFFPVYPYDCELDTAYFVNRFGYNDVQNILIDPPLTDEPTSSVVSLGIILGYGYSSPYCVDCTLRGNQTTPSFWK